MLLALAGAPVHACYELHAGGVLLSRSVAPPFDISYDENGPSADLVASRSRGEHLVMSAQPCYAQDVATAELDRGLGAGHYRTAVGAPWPAAGLRSGVGSSRGGVSSGSRGIAGSGRTAGTDVKVRAYHREDGTYVAAHTRAAPGRGKK